MHDLVAVRARVVAIATEKPKTLVQRDTFYKVSRGRSKLRELSETGELIFYERSDQAGPKKSTYTITPVPDTKSMHELLGRFLEERAVATKRREIIMVSQTRIHLDEVERLGSFLEFEVVLGKDQPDSEGVGIASRLMERLGIREDDPIEGAYVDLLGA